MKRFVTYLYECERGNKSKNVGFIRVNQRNEETTLEVYIKNILRPNDGGKIYALIYKKDLCGIELGEVKISNGQSDSHMMVQTENIMGSGASINAIEGIGIRLESGQYLASCWKDEYADAITEGKFDIWDESLQVNCVNEESHENFQEEESVELESTLAVAEECGEGEEKTEFSADTSREMNEGSHLRYEKIHLDQIRNLPSPNWHLSTNSFLVHGFANYGYLVLQKEMEADKEKLSLGVPGIFEKPEAFMAILFGFPTFEEIPSEMVTTEINCPMTFPQKEKNQETEVGTFGCWFVTLQE